jgi:hypothetical protein
MGASKCSSTSETSLLIITGLKKTPAGDRSIQRTKKRKYRKKGGGKRGKKPPSNVYESTINPPVNFPSSGTFFLRIPAR